MTTTATTFQQYIELVNTVKAHDYRYSVLNAPIISDQEYDALYRQLQQMEEQLGTHLADSPTQRLQNDLVEGRTVARRSSCLSMNKKYTTQEICKWMKDVARDVFRGRGSNQGSVRFVCEWKYDGVTASLVYLNGMLAEATYGHGAECKGTDFMAHARHIQGIPQTVEKWRKYGRVEIRGEVVCKKANRELIEGKAKTCCEAAKNVLAIEIPNVHDCELLDFIAFRMVDDTEAQCLMNKLLTGVGFNVAQSPSVDCVDGNTLFCDMWGKTVNVCEWSVEECRKAGKAERDAFPYPTDGIVFKVDDYSDYKYIHDTQSRHRFNIALKYMAEDQQAVTTYRGYHVTVGSTGKETCVAEYDMVVLNNKTFDHSAIGADLLKKLRLKPGDKIRVSIHGGAGGAFVDGRADDMPVTPAPQPHVIPAVENQGSGSASEPTESAKLGGTVLAGLLTVATVLGQAVQLTFGLLLCLFGVSALDN